MSCTWREKSAIISLGSAFILSALVGIDLIKTQLPGDLEDIVRLRGHHDETSE
jgi:hypothetical protein